MRRYGIWAIGLFMSVAMSYGFFSGNFLGYSKPVPKISPTPPNAEVTQKDLKVKVSPQTEIIQKVTYTKCGDEEITREKANQNLIGFTYQQVQQFYPGWTIETFDTKEIILTLVVDGYCKVHNDHMFLGTHNGHVAIFYGEPGSKALLKEETNIALQDIQPQDRNELEKGIVIKDRAELLQTLEGLQEHR